MESEADKKFEKKSEWVQLGLVLVTCAEMAFGLYIHAVITTMFLIIIFIMSLRKDLINVLYELKEANCRIKSLEIQMKYGEYRSELNRIRAAYNSKIPDVGNSREGFDQQNKNM